MSVKMMRSSYKEEDVCLLLKDITGLVAPLPALEREKLIQEGAHYCEMLPIEYVPGKKYREAYEKALECYAGDVARAVGVLGDKIIAQKGRDVILVSLARAGTPIGILLKRYLQKAYDCSVMHYSISIIRGKGIDKNAMKYLLERCRPEQLQFIDGWIGKGAILQELQQALQPYPGVSAELGVVADPAYATWLCGTHEDILIPSSCLNCTISGLISRTFLREDIIGKEDFHGALYYEELNDQDLSYAFIQAIEEKFVFAQNGRERKKDDKKPADKADPRNRGGGEGMSLPETYLGLEEAKRIAAEFKVENIHLVKPGIGETTRVLLRRVPWKVLVDPRFMQDPSIVHIIRLAEEKEVPVEEYSMNGYKTCGIIKRMADT